MATTAKKDTEKTATPAKAVAKKLPKKAPRASKAAKPAMSAAKQSEAVKMARDWLKKKVGLAPIEMVKGQKPHISSGCFALDDLIGGSLTEEDGKPVCPGYPRRAMTEIFGQYSSGKTTAALEAIAECHRNGGSAMFLDYERSLDYTYAKRLGVLVDDPDRFMIYAPDNLEDGFVTIWAGLKAGVDLIVVDSVSAMLPKSAHEKDLNKEATLGAQARKFSDNLPKLVTWLTSKEVSTNPLGTALIWLNQNRATISTGPGPKGPNTNTSGGNALKFYCWLRIMCSRTGSESVKLKDKITGKEKTVPYGNKTQVKMIKNKVDGKQGHATDIFIRYGHGIDEYYSLIAAGMSFKVISGSGNSLGYGGQKFQGRERLRKFLVANPDVFKEIRQKVLDCMYATAEEIETIDEDAEIDTFGEGFDGDLGDESLDD